MSNLLIFKKNYRCQSGEDGITEKVLHEAKVTLDYFIKFGAWDGVCLSNTCHLAEDCWGVVH